MQPLEIVQPGAIGQCGGDVGKFLHDELEHPGGQADPMNTEFAELRDGQAAAPRQDVQWPGNRRKQRCHILLPADEHRVDAVGTGIQIESASADCLG